MRLLLAWYAFFILVVHVVGCVFWVVSTNTHNFQLVTFNSQTTVLSVVFSLFYFFQYVKERFAFPEPGFKSQDPRLMS